MDRRHFLGAVGAAALTAPLLKADKLPIRKGVLITMLPKNLPLEDRFKLAIDTGWDVLECQTVADPKEAEAIKAAADKVKLPIHSVMNMAHWGNPLNSSDPKMVETGMKGMETSLRNAHFWGASAVLLVPAVVGPKFSYYQDAWTRSQAQIRKLIPLAQELKVVIAIEEVWNKFLLSPMEMARYIDEFNSPWVKAYLDVGNMMFYGFPEDWILTLGKRTAKIHLKDFRFQGGRTEWTALREGAVNWKAVHDALATTGYKDVVTVELSAGDEAYLKEVSHRVDLILAGE